MTFPSNLEDQQIECLNSIAAKYRSEGFEVILQPESEKLLSALAGFQPQAVAMKGDEWVFIDVLTTPSITTSDQLPLIAQTVQDNQDWRYELNIINTEASPYSEKVESDVIIKKREMYIRLKDAQDLIQNQYPEAALVLLCSVIIAALNYLVQREEINLKTYDPNYILKQFIFLGLVSRDDYWLLRLALKLMDVITNGIQCEDLEDNWLQGMFDATMRLMQR